MKFTNASDAGDFECQVSTNPKISQVFKLTVVGEKKSKDYIWVEWSKFHHIFLIPWVLEYDLRDNLSISYCTFCFNDKLEQFEWWIVGNQNAIFRDNLSISNIISRCNI